MSYKIKELPESDQPRTKLMNHGSSNLTDSELLALLLNSGTKEKNAKELGTEVIKKHGLKSLQELPIQKLCEIDGISKAKASRLKASAELGHRIRRTSRDKVNNFKQLVDMVKDLQDRDSEFLRIFALSSGNEMKREIEYEGNTENLEFPVSKLLRDIVLTGASGFILCHNHPSGSAEPSEADLLTTRRLIDASEVMGVKFLDHVIVGDRVLSMRASSEVQFH